MDIGAVRRGNERKSTKFLMVLLNFSDLPLRLNYILSAKPSFVSKHQQLVQLESVSTLGKGDNKREHMKLC